MRIFAAGGLTVTDCRIEAVEPSAEFGRYLSLPQPLAAGIWVGAGGPRGGPGKPDNFSGTFLISNNDVEVGGTAGDRTLGIAIFRAGRSPDSEVDVFISGNQIRNVTEPGINVQHVGGRVRVERNVITTAPASPAIRPAALRILGSGSYRIAHNSITCGMVGGGAVGIDLIGPAPPLAQLANAIVENNDVAMSAPAGTVFKASSAGISVGGFAQGNLVRRNRIRGRARAALAVFARDTRSPANTAFVANDLKGFQSSPDDIVIDAGATNTRIVGRKGTIADSGTGTVVLPVP